MGSQRPQTTLNQTQMSTIGPLFVECLKLELLGAGAGLGSPETQKGRKRDSVSGDGPSGFGEP